MEKMSYFAMLRNPLKNSYPDTDADDFRTFTVFSLSRGTGGVTRAGKYIPKFFKEKVVVFLGF